MENIKKNLLKYEARGMVSNFTTFWEKAENASVYDENGKKYIDFTSTIFVSNIGHGNKVLVKNLVNTIKKPLIHSYNNPHNLRLTYTKKLLKFLGEKNKKVLLLSGGSETTECALKLMRLYAKKLNKRKPGIITLKGNWHGRTMGSQLMSSNKEQKKWIGFKDPNMHYLDFPYPWLKCEKGFFKNSLKKINKKINHKKDICGVMLETFQGWGAIFYPKNYINEISTFCKKNKILLCFDEMQSGFGRTGKKFGYMHYNVKPNLICCGKGMGSGFPLSGIIGDKFIMDYPTPGSLGSTHSGNPMACAAGISTLQEILSKNLVNKSKKLGKVMHEKLNHLKTKYPNLISSIQGKGLIAAVIFKKKITTKLNGSKLASIIWSNCKNKGLLLVNTGRESLKIGPPLSITLEELNKGLNIIDKVIAKYSIN